MKAFKSWFEEMSARVAAQKEAEAEFKKIYTPRARQVFALAEREAKRLNHNFIGTEHVLVGLLWLAQGIAVSVLRKKGVTLEAARAEVEKHVGRGPEQPINLPIPFTPRVKRALGIAKKEARSLSHTYVGTEHVLLGLLADNEGLAARILKDFGLNVEDTRREISLDSTKRFEFLNEKGDVVQSPRRLLKPTSRAPQSFR